MEDSHNGCQEFNKMVLHYGLKAEISFVISLKADKQQYKCCFETICCIHMSAVATGGNKAANDLLYINGPVWRGHWRTSRWECSMVGSITKHPISGCSFCQNNLFLCIRVLSLRVLISCHPPFCKREDISVSSPGWSSHWKWMNHISWWHLWVFIRKFILWWETQVHHGCCCCSTTLQELLARKHGSGGRWQKFSRKNKMRFNVAPCPTLTVQSESGFGRSLWWVTQPPCLSVPW